MLRECKQDTSDCVNALQMHSCRTTHVQQALRVVHQNIPRFIESNNDVACVICTNVSITDLQMCFARWYPVELVLEALHQLWQDEDLRAAACARINHHQARERAYCAAKREHPGKLLFYNAPECEELKLLRAVLRLPVSGGLAHAARMALRIAFALAKSDCGVEGVFSGEQFRLQIMVRKTACVCRSTSGSDTKHLNKEHAVAFHFVQERSRTVYMN